jgi:ankyrin repeat protein
MQDAFGRTPLHTAVESGLLAAVLQLLDYGARTDIQDFSGAAPIHLAVLQKDYQVALLLFPKNLDDACFIGASAWRSLLPGDESHLEIAEDQPTFIMKQLESTIRDKVHPLFLDATQVASKDHGLMAAAFRSRRLL